LRRHLAGGERDDVEKSEGNDAKAEAVGNPFQLFFDQNVRSLEPAVEDIGQSDDREKGKMEKV